MTSVAIHIGLLASLVITGTGWSGETDDSDIVVTGFVVGEPRTNPNPAATGPVLEQFMRAGQCEVSWRGSPSNHLLLGT